ncbi:unnamed protein product [Schistosoma mattheei]|uniref:Uncharacterized protein n=1 Tax=Schistosoma mattheei TaxID=31246 RepID=A0A183NNY9_9TREM|nr:unnamed protein product [Schistosoma mattheei]
MLLVMIQWVMKVPLNVGVQFNQSKKFYYLLLVCLQEIIVLFSKLLKNHTFRLNNYLILLKSQTDQC